MPSRTRSSCRAVRAKARQLPSKSDTSPNSERPAAGGGRSPVTIGLRIEITTAISRCVVTLTTRVASEVRRQGGIVMATTRMPAARRRQCPLRVFDHPAILRGMRSNQRRARKYRGGFASLDIRPLMVAEKKRRKSRRARLLRPPRRSEPDASATGTRAASFSTSSGSGEKRLVAPDDLNDPRTLPATTRRGSARVVLRDKSTTVPV